MDIAYAYSYEYETRGWLEGTHTTVEKSENVDRQAAVVVAEWLRRQTRNLLGLARVGSNPADNADITFAISYGYSEIHCGRGGVVKATDSKFVGPSPRTFKSRRQSRYYFCNFIWILHLHMNMKPGVGGGYSYYSGKIGERRSTSCRFKPASRRVTSQQPFDDHRLTSRPPAG
ncbi:unnamed protein product [Clavelina lepadiformis]|uniref:Uncharacterized protein n=1 Tax=Clavelina lepadiformis TaxID=159417 RepID=A0ABP0FR79_CLALP